MGAAAPIGAVARHAARGFGSTQAEARKWWSQVLIFHALLFESKVTKQPGVQSNGVARARVRPPVALRAVEQPRARRVTPPSH
eukprot:scaffold98418_cov69-Phaeocystis_antarctica.AAC.3